MAEVVEQVGIVLVDAEDADAGAGLGRGEGGHGEVGEAALRIGDGVAVGVGGGASEVGIDLVEEFVADGVLEALGFIVDLGPIEREDADEEGLDQAVAADDAEGNGSAFGRELDSGVTLVADEFVGREPLDHGGDGAGSDGEGVGDIACRGLVGRGAGLKEEDGLEVVLDGDGGRGFLGRGRARGLGPGGAGREAGLCGGSRHRGSIAAADTRS